MGRVVCGDARSRVWPGKKTSLQHRQTGVQWYAQGVERNSYSYSYTATTLRDCLLLHMSPSPRDAVEENGCAAAASGSGRQTWLHKIDLPVWSRASARTRGVSTF